MESKLDLLECKDREGRCDLFQRKAESPWHMTLTTSISFKERLVHLREGRFQMEHAIGKEEKFCLENTKFET